MATAAVSLQHTARDSRPLSGQEDILRRFLEKEKEKGVGKHQSAIEAPSEERCLTRRFASLNIRHAEPTVNFLVLGREKSGKSTFISAIMQCPDYRYFVSKVTEVCTTVGLDEEHSTTEFEPFTIRLTEIDFGSIEQFREVLISTSQWAVIWTVDAERFAREKSSVKEELNNMRKYLETPLENLGIRGLLVVVMRKSFLLKREETDPKPDKPGYYANQLTKFIDKVEEWGKSLNRVIRVTCPFPDNPPNVDSPLFLRNVRRGLRHFFMEEGVDVIPWSTNIIVQSQQAFPRRLAILVTGHNDAAVKLFKEKCGREPPRPKPETEEEEEKAVEAAKAAVAEETFLTKRNYHFTKMRGWHPGLKVEIAKEEVISFKPHLTRISPDDPSTDHRRKELSDNFRAIKAIGPYDDAIVVIVIDSPDALKNAAKIMGNAVAVLPDNPPILVYFSGQMQKVDPNQIEQILALPHLRSRNENVIHCYFGSSAEDLGDLNGALYGTIHKLLMVKCGHNVWEETELHWFASSQVQPKFDEDYTVGSVAAR